MALSLYMDQHVPRAITNGLRLRNVDVITAYEDQSHEWDDPDLLDRATRLGRALFTHDDLLQEATRRQKVGIHFSGVIFAHQLRETIGQCVEDLAIIASIADISDVENQVIFLPL
ncbi:DUF5615 family PIN-like protein [Roseiflexus sp.]|uniref:DUF5615 family PIN-like protein n=1 Tax=Roseiflexus sp. TaxID=2562120 RepID=UPI00398B5CD9